MPFRVKMLAISKKGLPRLSSQEPRPLEFPNLPPRLVGSVYEVLGVLVAFGVHDGKSGADCLLLSGVSAHDFSCLTIFLRPLAGRQFDYVVWHVKFGERLARAGCYVFAS